MKFNTEITEYITNKKFSPALDVYFGHEKYPGISRIDKLVRLTKHKNVIHLGCADHLPLIDQKRKNGKWLHGLLSDNCNKCIGIDINTEAVNYLCNEVGLKNVFVPGQKVDEIILSSKIQWDYIILGELIEHVDNPVQFLLELHEKYASFVKQIIITAPNVYSWITINDIKNNKENINSDHNYWFSPYTLTKVAHKAGFRNTELYFADRVKLPLMMTVLKRLKEHSGITPYFRANCFNSIILIASF